MIATLVLSSVSATANAAAHPKDSFRIDRGSGSRIGGWNCCCGQRTATCNAAGTFAKFQLARVLFFVLFVIGVVWVLAHLSVRAYRRSHRHQMRGAVCLTLHV